jgi:hypothetical protein
MLISALMFSSGYFFGKHSSETHLRERTKREEEIKQEVARRMGKPKSGPEEEKEEPAERKSKGKKG